jgi:hypothetical protein
MKKLSIVLSAALPLLVLAPAHAQNLETGTWAGSVTAPGETLPMDVTYDVKMNGDTIGITVNAGEHGTFPFRDVRLSDQTLTFWFSPGVRVECTLTRREDGAFAGPCRDSEGGNASMVMVPPKKS